MTNEIKWSNDHARSQISFKVKHLMIAYVKGTFKKIDAQIITTGNDFNMVRMNLKIQASSLTTGDPNRDEILKSYEFLDIQHHSEIILTTKTICKYDSAGNYTVWGDLNMKGISKPIKLNVQFGGVVIDKMGKHKARYTITGRIYRSDWELVWNTAMVSFGLMLSDEVLISGELELNKQAKKYVSTEPDLMLNENAIWYN
jgi:polyisoprenoid-binding protein YceI